MDADSVTYSLMRSCYPRSSTRQNRQDIANIFNLFVDAAVDGRIQLDVEAVYRQLVNRRPVWHMNLNLRLSYDIACRPSFRVTAIDDAACRFTPLGHPHYVVTLNSGAN